MILKSLQLYAYMKLLFLGVLDWGRSIMENGIRDKGKLRNKKTSRRKNEGYPRRY